MTGQAIYAHLSFCADIDPCSRGREIYGGTGSLDKLAAEIIPVEKAVHVSAEDAARFADGAVRRGLRQVVA